MYGAVWLGLSTALSGAPVEPGPTIVVSWSDGHGLVRDRDAVRAEIEAILEGAGIRLRWSDAVGEPGPEPGLPVSVVVTPSEPSGAGWNISPSAMGVYLASEESSAVFVFYRRVARVLGVSSERNGMMDPSDARRLARALGRVAVHELVHRVAPDLGHADSGLMREDLGRSHLTRKNLELDEGSRAAVLAVLRETRRGVPTANHLSPGPRTK
jgi:hypothetical protein